MLPSLDRLFLGRPAGQIFAGAAAAALLVGAIDFAAGRTFSLWLFYAAPVLFCAWYSGRKNGLILAAVSAGVSLIASMNGALAAAALFISFWNALMQFGMYALCTLLATELHGQLALEELLADTDPLTGLANRRAFCEKLDMEAIRAGRYGHPFTVMYISLDDFGAVNDMRGHTVGDDVLRRVSDILKKNTRSLDSIARVGGDEFAALFPEIAYEAAQNVLQKLQQLLETAMRENQWPVTFSIGALTFGKSNGDLRDIVTLVDNLTLKVRQNGKNSVLHEYLDATVTPTDDIL